MQPTTRLAALAAAGLLSVCGQYAEVDAARVKQLAQVLPERPAGIGPPCSNRAAWKPLASDAALRRAEAILTKPFPAWNDDAYLDFSRTGTRPMGEAMLRPRQAELAPLVLAECGEYQGRFLERIALGLDELAGQKAWTLPAHDGKLENYRGTLFFVDLNAAGLAHSIAEALYLLGDRLPEKTRAAAMAALEQRIFAPVRKSIATGNGNDWLKRTNNWNPVCVHGVTGAALAVVESRDDRALFAAAAEHYSAYFLNGFTNDGYAEEGIGYWSYGFSNFAELREVLWRATNGTLDLYRDRKALQAALYGVQFQMLPGNYADFADARFLSKPDPALLADLGRVFGFGAAEAPARSGSGPIALVSYMLAAFPNRRSELKSPTVSASLGLRTYYPDVGVLVARPAAGGRLAVTIKAGGNGSHSHNDVGSFAIGLGATQPVGDPGGPYFYTSKTFTNARYESKLLNSFGHPVPVVGGKLQLEATKLHIPVLKTQFTDEVDTFAMDLTSAYDAPELKRLERTMRFSRAAGGAVEIEDRFELNAETAFEEGLPTHGAWRRVDARTLEFELSGERVRVEVTAPAPFEVTAEKIDEYGNPFTRAGIRLLLKGSGSVKMRFTAAN